jgi:Xaa-Pro aminopeptidase
MKYRSIPSDLFISNRYRLAREIPKDAFAVFHSSEIPWRCADGSTRFIQNSDLFYLTGADQEETILVVCPGHSDPKMREILFIRETSELLKVWEGHKLSKEHAAEISGIKNVQWTDEFDHYLRILARENSIIYLNANECSSPAEPLHLSRDARFRRRCQELYQNHQYRRLGPVMHRLRQEKSPIEIDQLQTACDITAKGFRRVLEFVKPGVMEYEIEAELIHEFIRHGSRGFAYEPIIASGKNSCVLHYLSNDQKCRDGDLLLLDVAAEYANYNADLTRTIPVSGKFTTRQRAVYEAVLRIFRLCINELIVPGKDMREVYAKEVARATEEELINLGLLDPEVVAKERKENTLPEEQRCYRKYFMHSVSHSLGIDVHDVTSIEKVFVENMCVTVEPGIYLPEEGFGVRLENDVIVRPGGNLDLMAHIPIEPDEIEALMA